MEGSVRLQKSNPRFGRFEVRFSIGSDAPDLEFCGSTQDYCRYKILQMEIRADQKMCISKYVIEYRLKKL